jgi:hypothetical protein
VERRARFSGAMEAWSMTRCLCVGLALVCLTSLWAPAVAQTDFNDGKLLENLLPRFRKLALIMVLV